MAYVIERTFVRPDTSTAWPWANVTSDKQTEIDAMRTAHNVTLTVTNSADNLSAVYTERCDSYNEYRYYFSQVKSLWTETGIVTEENASGVTTSTTAANNVSVTISVLENT